MKTLTALVAAMMLTVPAVAIAEDLGPAGYVTRLEVNTQSADMYLQHHGRVTISSSGKQGQSTEYRWGGQACGTRVLTPELVAMLQRALQDGSLITPRWQDGQGITKCLVGFTLG